jgi:hypothetical protein
MSIRKLLAVSVVIGALTVAPQVRSAEAWDSFGHMLVAYEAYQQLTPTIQARVTTLVHLNPSYDKWSGWMPPATSAADRDAILFMVAATWADEIKAHGSGYTMDGSHNGNRPEGSPDPTANVGYSDKLMHKYWHFVDTPFSTDGSPLPPIPTPNAQERIGLFRGVLSSAAPDPLKSYDLVWLVHLVGDVHQPLHATTRVSASAPDGDDGGNGVKLPCPGCRSQLHSFWDGAAGVSASVAGSIPQAIAAAKKLPKASASLAAKSSEADWVQESFQAAQADVYKAPVGAGDGPFTLTTAYKAAATKLARARIALAAARLANLLNNELK